MLLSLILNRRLIETLQEGETAQWDEKWDILDVVTEPPNSCGIGSLKWKKNSSG